MAELVGDLFRGMPWYLYVILLLAIGLLIASFVVPPLGVLDPSVLKGVALIIGGTWLLYTTANVPTFIQAGAKIKASYGNAKIEIAHRNDEDDENNEKGDE